MHNVLALGIIMQKDGSQPIHLPVMLSEQRLKCLFSSRHTPIIHMKTDLLNPKGHFFPFFFVHTRFCCTKIVISFRYLLVESGKRECSSRARARKYRQTVEMLTLKNRDQAAIDLDDTLPFEDGEEGVDGLADFGTGTGEAELAGGETGDALTG